MHSNNAGANHAPLKTPLIYIIEGKEFETISQYKTGLELKTQAGIPENVDLYLKIQEPYEDELIENDKSVNLARPDIERFFVKKRLRFTLNSVEFIWYDQYITGSQLRKLGGIPEDHDIYLDIKEGYKDDFITDDEVVDLARPGVEHFFSKKREVELVKISVNDKPFEVSKGKHTVAGIKTVAGVPLSHELEQLLSGKLTPLPDEGELVIVGEEEFFSHVRDGASS